MGSIAQEASEHRQKVATAGRSIGLSENSVLLGMTEEEILRAAEQVEVRGEVQVAAERIVSMQKEASASSSGPSAEEIRKEMKKMAFRRAAQRMGLISKEAGAFTAVPVLRVLFAGNHPIQKLAEVAAHYARLRAGF